jgi:hypothetical protein
MALIGLLISEFSRMELLDALFLKDTERELILS